MLEIRYHLVTKQLTAWRGNEKLFGKLDRKGHAVVVINTPIPEKPPAAWLFDMLTNSLINNPDYIQPVPPRNLSQDIDSLKERVKRLEKPL